MKLEYEYYILNVSDPNGIVVYIVQVITFVYLFWIFYLRWANSNEGIMDTDYVGCHAGANLTVHVAKATQDDLLFYGM